MAGITERLINEDAKFAEGTTVPANTSVTPTTKIRSGEGGQLGSKILLRAKTACALADTKKINLIVLHCDTEGGSYLELGRSVYTASGATSFAANDVIAEFNLPRTAKEFTQVSVATDDATATGTFDCFYSSAVGYSNV